MRRLLAALTIALLPCAASAAPSGPALGLPDLTDKQVEQYRDLSSKAVKALQSGEHAKAARLYERAARLHGGNDGLWYNLACARSLQSLTAPTLEALDRALAAGWRDAAWAGKDTDLATVHGTLAFEQWSERVEAAAAEGTTWPMPDAATLAATPDEIEEGRDRGDSAIARLSGVLGREESGRAQRALAAWTASSWDKVAALADDDDARAEALREAIASVAGSDATRLSSGAASEVLRRTATWLDEFAGLEGASAVRLTEAEAQHAQRLRSDDEAGEESAEEAFERDLLLLAATAEPGPALEGALVRLIGMSGDDVGTATRLYGRLIATAEDADEARAKMRSGYATRGVTYKIEGLPAFEATTTDGATYTASKLPGRVTLLDFWATWCGPCRAELPNLKATYEKYHDDGFDILGISLDKESDKDQAAFLAWCEENGLPWPQVYDGKYWESRLAGEFGVRAIPFALLVDEDGDVVAADDDLRGEALMEAVARALGAEATAGVGGQ
jgi:thiol-disulfide isomerase/thioredoxin